ncbi:MAG TPA: PilN domain-containing protein [Thermoanaerobaculia bacterium]|nr:PilN domain-containing protein [Thermoanaerobaculia bacterium]
MIKINLLSEGRTAARAPVATVATGRINNAVFVGCIALAILYFLGMWWHVASVKRDWDEKNRRAQAEVDRLKSIIDEVNGYEKKKASLEAKINLINDLKRNQHGPVRLMDEVSKALPDLVWLNSMNLIGNAIQINGKAMTPNAVANFIENLKKSPYFAEPRFQALNQEGPIYNFGLSVTFTYVTPTETPAAPATATPGSAPATPPAAKPAA